MPGSDERAPSDVRLKDRIRAWLRARWSRRAGSAHPERRPFPVAVVVAWITGLLIICTATGTVQQIVTDPWSFIGWPEQETESSTQWIPPTRPFPNCVAALDGFARTVYADADVRPGRVGELFPGMVARLHCQVGSHESMYAAYRGSANRGYTEVAMYRWVPLRSSTSADGSAQLTEGIRNGPDWRCGQASESSIPGSFTFAATCEDRAPAVTRYLVALVSGHAAAIATVAIEEVTDPAQAREFGTAVALTAAQVALGALL